MQETAALYGLSESSLYRALRERARPKALQRADRGAPRVLPSVQLERLCEVIAALKIRTSNKKGRHLSTVQAIRLLEEHGVETPDGLLKAPKEVLSRSTVNRYLKQWGFDYRTLMRVPPAVRFEARHSNECWHFDLSPSDLKHVKRPAWFEEGRGHPLLMLYTPVGGPIPLNRYRRFKKPKTQRRTERIEALAETLALPESVWGGTALDAIPGTASTPSIATTAFIDPDPFQEIRYPSALAAKRAIAEYLNVPLAKLPADGMEALDRALATSLRKTDVIEYARNHLKPLLRG